jgi:hypothetical protein
MVIPGFFFHWKFLKRLKEEHLDVWNELGQPSLFLNNSINWRVTKFLFGRKYLEVGDEFLTKMGDFMLVFYSVYYLIFIGFFSFIIISTRASH